MLAVCTMCFLAFAASNVVAIRVPCSHCFCEICFKFMASCKFSCPTGCRNLVGLSSEDGLVVKMRFITTTEKEDGKVVGQYVEAAQLEKWRTRVDVRINVETVKMMEQLVENKVQDLGLQDLPFEDAIDSSLTLISSLAASEASLNEAVEESNKLYAEYQQAVEQLRQARTTLYSQQIKRSASIAL
ncbi:hypothetical protein EST38_g10940 [Candolleomyces aberdarensis]|uniref:RING-type domain-containing protein n=1 Tax=Candolleomyces aberdarensis TaxID=2316362 RepID=A0A4V1Q2F6_9AGAR|nr:hypothetical protein EST38_g10940 [Candolleomyces aberdarensis]